MGKTCKSCRRPSDHDRFWRRVDKSGTCWLWLGSRHKNGHGYAWFGGAPMYAHRAAWTLTHGPIPDSLDVCHHCDNPPCVNPTHLFLGTHADNMHDAAVKGRALVAGIKRATLTVGQVQYVKAQLRAGRTQQSIADQVGVTRACIGVIAQGRRWGWVA